MSPDYPALVHAAVISAAADDADGEQLAALLTGALVASGRYHVVAACDDCEASASSLGIDQVITVERVDEDTLGVRVLDVWDRGVRRDKALVWSLDLLVDRLFLAPGSLAIDAPIDAAVFVDGRSGSARADVSAGKHTVLVTAQDRYPTFDAVVVRPGAVAHVTPAPARPLPTRGTPVAAIVAMSVLLVGGTGLALGGTPPSVAP